MIEIEQTSNFGGGTVWPLEAIQAVAEVAQRHELVMHMDGARLMNAVVASGVPARDYSAPFDSVWIDLSKGLGCPVGGVLAGSADFIAQAWRWKQRIGGAMRQAGIVASAGVYALENNVERLAEDHANARLLADRLAELPGIAIDPETVETNIVFFDVAGTDMTAGQVAEGLAEHGVRVGPMGESLIRRRHPPRRHHRAGRGSRRSRQDSGRGRLETTAGMPAPRYRRRAARAISPVNTLLAAPTRGESQRSRLHY